VERLPGTPGAGAGGDWVALGLRSASPGILGAAELEVGSLQFLRGASNGGEEIGLLLEEGFFLNVFRRRKLGSVSFF